MSSVEQKRLMLLGEVEQGRLCVGEVAEVTGRSIRQVRRWLAAWRDRGAAGIAHGNRGRPPPNALPQSLRDRVRELAAGKYAGLNVCHLTDLLEEREGIVVSRSSVWRIMVNACLERRRKRRLPRHRRRRERFPREGMLLQMDGSFHDWLEGRGPWLTLIGAIDDATGKVPYALFREQEDSVGYMRLMEGVIRGYGKPLAVYHDRTRVLVNDHPNQEDETPGIAAETWREGLALTQVGRMLKELDIEPIISWSPQSRGRIERLWGTFQDRLVSELRLERASSIEDANRLLSGYLERHNRRFAVPAADPEPAWVPVPTDFRHREYFCFRHKRMVGTDNVVRYENQRLQILPCHGRLSYARLEVEVREQLDEQLSVHYQGRQLDIRPAPLEATAQRGSATVRAPSLLGRPLRAPETDHPWRRWVHRATK